MSKLDLRYVLYYLLLSAPCLGEEAVFPHKMPDRKPDMELSSAMQRMYRYPAPRVQDNELFSQFKYTPLRGLDNNDGDGTISRRDPSRPILVNGRYHIWYTRRHTSVPPIGASRAHEATDQIPSTDWDLCEIWHATSKDGFTWEEQEVAVPRPPQPIPGCRSVATPDILVWRGKYYLYYQAFVEPSGTRGDWCSVSASYADSPITWGLCHFINAGTWGKRHSIMARFDCDLSLDVHDPAMKTSSVWHSPDVYFKQGLSAAQRQRIADANQRLIAEDE